MLSGRHAGYPLPFVIRGLLFIVVTTIPEEMEPLTIVPGRAFNPEVRVEEKDVEYCQLFKDE